MKKFFAIILVSLMVVTLAVTPAYARPGKVVVKGLVESVDSTAGKVVIQTKPDSPARRATETVWAPAGFDLEWLEVGDWLLVKGARQEDGSIKAHFLKQVGHGGDEGKKDGELGKTNSAFCAGGEQTKPHPVALKISAHYGVTPEWVMEQFCAGYGMGAIMLALKTQQLSDLEPEALLAARSEGKGWGQIWKDAGLVGKGNGGKIPPGQLKKSGEGSSDSAGDP